MYSSGNSYAPGIERFKERNRIRPSSCLRLGVRFLPDWTGRACAAFFLCWNRLDQLRPGRAVGIHFGIDPVKNKLVVRR